MIDNTAFFEEGHRHTVLDLPGQEGEGYHRQEGKQTIPDQGATERRDSLRGVSKGEGDSIRARERLFTVFPQISDVRKTGSFKRTASPSKPILAKLRQRMQQNFGGTAGCVASGSCVSAGLNVE